MIKQVIANSLY